MVLSLPTILQERLTQNGFVLTKVQIDQLLQFIDLLSKWNKIINLTAHREPIDVIDKDILDSLYTINIMIRTHFKTPLKSREGVGGVAGGGLPPRAVSSTAGGEARTGPAPSIPYSCLDMGSGGGAFGITLAITHPQLRVGFLESDRKKINFTKQVFRELGLTNGIFVEKRAEDYPKEYQNRFLLCVTRATWSWNEFLKHAHYYVQNYGHVFWMSGPQKGRRQQPVDLLGFADHQVYDYTILPKNYKRTILISKKIS